MATALQPVRPLPTETLMRTRATTHRFSVASQVLRLERDARVLRYAILDWLDHRVGKTLASSAPGCCPVVVSIERRLGGWPVYAINLLV